MIKNIFFKISRKNFTYATLWTVETLNVSSTALYSFIFHFVFLPVGAFPVQKTIVFLTPIIRLSLEMTGPGDPVAFQYPESVVLFGLPPLASRSCLGTKKNHCSASPRHLSPAISAKRKLKKKQQTYKFHRPYMTNTTTYIILMKQVYVL